MRLIKYITTVAVTGIVLAGLSSCKKSFLEVQPKGKIIATKTSDYDLLLNNLDLINIVADAQVLMGDEVVAVDPFYTSTAYRPQRLFRWDNDIYEPADDAPETLIPLRDLYTYNLIINEVLNSTDGSDQQKKSLQAEALAGRAWTYFLLINYFGKPYSAATAATDPGFPLITKADINGTDFRRASVQQVYDLIVSDLTTAVANLSVESVGFRTRMSGAAAQGLLAKVYMFMGKFDLALPLLNASIAGIAGSAVPTDLYDFNAAFPGFPTAPNDFENVFAKAIFNTYTGSASAPLMLTPQAGALYGTTDIRRTKWYTSTTFPNSLVLLRRSGNFSTYYGVRVPDLYLLRAEVKARLNDLAGAVTDVEMLRKKRMPVSDAPVPAAIAGQKLPLLQFIMEERIREFAVQGYRWFDMRRLSVDPLFTTPVYTHLLYGATGTVTSTFTLRPERFTLRIPKKILQQNPNMQDNP